MMTHMIKELNASLAERKLRVPADRAAGQKYGLDYAEEFHYIGPDRSMDEYIARHAVPL